MPPDTWEFFLAGHQTLWHHTRDGNQGQLQLNLSQPDGEAERVKMGPHNLCGFKVKVKDTWKAPGNWT